MTSAWIGIDLGTQSVRAVALDEHGHVTSAACPLASTRSGDRHEQDPTSWRAAAADALRRVTGSLSAHVQVQAVAVSGTSGTIVPVDRNGVPQGPAVMYDDARGRPFLERVEEEGATVWRRLGYRMQPSWGLPKMLTMRDESALPSGSVFAHQPDVVTSWLAGRLLPSDLSSALKSGADLDTVQWPEAVFDALNLPASQINSLARSGEQIGSVGAAAAQVTGLPAGCAIVSGMTDGCAAQIASGALGAGEWNSVLGTTLVLKGAAPVRRPDSDGAVYAHRAPFGGGWYPGGASSTGARAVTELLPGADLADITRQAAAEPGIPVAYPLVGLGERFPFVAPDARGFGPARTPISALPEGRRFAAIAYGVAFIERLAFEHVASIGYDITGRTLVTGGGSRNHWWNQLRANVLNRPLHRPAHSEGALGMALLASAAVDSTGSTDPLRTAATRLLAPPTQLDPVGSARGEIEDAYLDFTHQLEQEGWAPSRLPLSAGSAPR